MDDLAHDVNNSVPSEAALSVDASYIVDYSEKGVYLIVAYEQGAGEPLIPELVSYDIIRRGLPEISLIALITRLKKREQMIKLSDESEEKRANADFAVKLNRSEMIADMMLFPPSAGGNELIPNQVLSQLRDKWHISYGVDEKAALHAVADKMYYTPITIARGREPERGRDGFLTIQFKTEHNHAPRILSDGSADYKSLDIFETAQEGELLAVATPPDDGVPGTTVTGKTLSALRGKAVRIPGGKNTRTSADGLKLFAAKSGRVDYTAGRIEVSDVLRISGDADMSTGNIDFPGDVEIRGNVISGLTIRADGNIEILGAAEAASIIAGKNIVLKTGIQGMDKGVLEAGGNITARFIEKTQACAKGSVYSDYIAHSRVSALGQVVMNGRHGKIVGSVVRSGKEVIARAISSNSLIEIGVSPEMRARLVTLEDRCIQTKAQMDKIDGIMGTMPAESSQGNPLYKKLLLARKQLDLEQAECADEIDTLRRVLAERSGGKIHVIGVIDQDVRLIIDSLQYLVKSNMEFATFRYRDGEIIFGACEKSQI